MPPACCLVSSSLTAMELSVRLAQVSRRFINLSQLGSGVMADACRRPGDTQICKVLKGGPGSDSEFTLNSQQMKRTG